MITQEMKSQNLKKRKLFLLLLVLMNSQRIDVLAINETKLDSSLLYPVIVILPSKICIVRYIIGKANPIYLGLNKMKFSGSPLITFDDFRDPPPMTSSSKQIWGLPFWILPKFSAIPPFCSHKNQVAFFSFITSLFISVNIKIKQTRVR